MKRDQLKTTETQTKRHDKTDSFANFYSKAVKLHPGQDQHPYEDTYAKTSLEAGLDGFARSFDKTIAALQRAKPVKGLLHPNVREAAGLIVVMKAPGESRLTRKYRALLAEYLTSLNLSEKEVDVAVREQSLYLYSLFVRQLIPYRLLM